MARHAGGIGTADVDSSGIEGLDADAVLIDGDGAVAEAGDFTEVDIDGGNDTAGLGKGGVAEVSSDGTTGEVEAAGGDGVGAGGAGFLGDVDAGGGAVSAGLGDGAGGGESDSLAVGDVECFAEGE